MVLYGPADGAMAAPKGTQAASGGGSPILSPRGDGGFRVCGPGTRLPWRPARGGTDRPFRARGQGACRAHPRRRDGVRVARVYGQGGELRLLCGGPTRSPLHRDPPEPTRGADQLAPCLGGQRLVGHVGANGREPGRKSGLWTGSNAAARSYSRVVSRNTTPACTFLTPPAYLGGCPGTLRGPGLWTRAPPAAHPSYGLLRSPGAWAVA